MSRGKWVGIGIVIGVVATLVAASLILTMSPRTAEAMHLLRVSTVTRSVVREVTASIPVYRTVTSYVTETKTLTKYLGGRVVTTTSIVTTTVTSYRLERPLYCGLIVKTVTIPKTITVIAPKTGIIPIWIEKVSTLYNLLEKIVTQERHLVFIGGVPSLLHFDITSIAVLAHSKYKYFAFTLTEARDYLMMLATTMAERCAPINIINETLINLVNKWEKDLYTLAINHYIIIITTGTPAPQAMLFSEYYPLSIATTQYVVGIPPFPAEILWYCRGKAPEPIHQPILVMNRAMAEEYTKFWAKLRNQSWFQKQYFLFRYSIKLVRNGPVFGGSYGGKILYIPIKILHALAHNESVKGSWFLEWVPVWNHVVKPMLMKYVKEAIQIAEAVRSG